MRRFLFCFVFAMVALCNVAFSVVPDSIDIKWMVDGNLYSQSTCEYGGDVILPTNPTKRGHTFIGWRRDYIELEYLESTGTQYIDTGIKPNSNIKIEVIYLVKKLTKNNNVAIYGSVQGTKGCFLGVASSSYYINDTSNASLLPSFVLGVQYEDVVYGETCIHNGLYYSIPPIVDSYMNIYLFGRIRDEVIERIGELQIFGFRIYDSGMLIQDLIPVLDLYGVPCMYDRVTEKFFYNQGTGQFIARPIKS